MTIEHIAFAARKAADRNRTDKVALKAAGFQDFKDWDPVDAGGFGSHTADLVSFQPIGESMQVGGVSAEDAYALGLAFTGDAKPPVRGRQY